MKTSNIFKALAFALLLTTACNKNEIANDENVIKKGYELPVTINVTRQDEAPASKATYNDGTRKLEFSAGDKLFVSGTGMASGGFAGTLTWTSGGTFSGTILTQNEYSGTANELLTAAYYKYADLLPNGYETYNFFSINNEGTYSAYVSNTYVNAFATSKAAAIEQFSFESAMSYSSGFALTPKSAILNFTITGFTAGTEVAVVFSYSSTTVSDNVTTDGSGNATFAIGVPSATDLNSCTLTVAGNAITLVGSSKEVVAGKIYNITRSVLPAGNTIDLSTVTVATTAQNGDVLTGELANNVTISIADGATVTLDGVSINASGTWKSGKYAGLTCLGDATIILKDGTTNTVKGFYEDYPGIFVPQNKTLTIQGTGSLTASSNGWGAGIGGGYDISCGNIDIRCGTITATGGENGAGIGSGGINNISVSCGSISISGGTITATGGENGAGIGSGGHGASCGGITIGGGTVHATGGNDGAGIGSGGDGSSCGNITIRGGEVTATGGQWAAGIGGGGAGGTHCGAITITNDVTSVTATKGSSAPNSIGAGSGYGSDCGTVTIKAGANVTQN